MFILSQHQQPSNHLLHLHKNSRHTTTESTFRLPANPIWLFPSSQRPQTTPFIKLSLRGQPSYIATMCFKTTLIFRLCGHSITLHCGPCSSKPVDLGLASRSEPREKSLQGPDRCPDQRPVEEPCEGYCPTCKWDGKEREGLKPGEIMPDGSSSDNMWQRRGPSGFENCMLNPPIAIESF